MTADSLSSFVMMTDNFETHTNNR